MESSSAVPGTALFFIRGAGLLRRRNTRAPPVATPSRLDRPREASDGPAVR
jgi:hypothetical protein